MTAMAELQPITEKFAVVLSGRANELAQQIQQVWPAVCVLRAQVTSYENCGVYNHSLMVHQRTVVYQMQAAIQPVSSSDKLELVDQLTDYVSDALAEVKCGMLLSALQQKNVVFESFDGFLAGVSCRR